MTAAVELLDGGATVPFIARYRKEVTGALDDVQLRTLQERLRYLRELDERRAAILDSIGAQGKLDQALTAQLMAADSKARLEPSTCPTSPGAGPGRSSPGKRDWSRWPTCCLAIPARTRGRRRPAS